MNLPITQRILFVFFTLSFTAFSSSESYAEGKKTNCKIAVVNTMKSGKVKKRVFNSNAENEGECAARAKDFEVNFFPPKIEKTEVKYEWGVK